jgi:hypothetical protein
MILKGSIAHLNAAVALDVVFDGVDANIIHEQTR